MASAVDCSGGDDSMLCSADPSSLWAMTDDDRYEEMDKEIERVANANIYSHAVQAKIDSKNFTNHVVVNGRRTEELLHTMRQEDVAKIFGKSNGASLVSDIESSAWEKFMNDSIIQRDIDILKDLGLSLGSAAAGDMENAVGYGMSALEKFWENEKEMSRIADEKINKQLERKEISRKEAERLREERHAEIAREFREYYESAGTHDNPWDRECGKR